MLKCSIKRCGNEAVAKGLCRKHYMRLRRNGDATATKTPGPKPRADPVEELARSMVRDRSPRTLARSRRALTFLLALGSEIAMDYAKTSTADGAVNVSKLLRLAEDEVLRQMAKVHGFDSRRAPDVFGNPDNRQLRADWLSASLKSIRAWLKAREE
jgi:hypothetical protein